MKTAFLFSCYKDPDVCKNRLRHLARFNPDIPIHILYGGPEDQLAVFQKTLSPLYDDFYHFDEPYDSHWRWLNFDLMILKWFQSHGVHLEWDTIISVHWDQLILDSIKVLFPHLKKGELLLTGLRPVYEVESFWYWTNGPDGKNRVHYEAFCEHLNNVYRYDAVPMACQFLLCFFPKEFLKALPDVLDADKGFLEYRIPMFAQVLGFPFCKEHQIPSMWWSDKSREWGSKEQMMHAEKMGQHSLRNILREARNPDGARLVHPFTGIYPLDVNDFSPLVAHKLKKLLVK